MVFSGHFIVALRPQTGPSHGSLEAGLFIPYHQCRKVDLSSARHSGNVSGDKWSHNVE